jgi:Response regulator containing CheY-like receiver, AAA-type ATPase, and DNA-binding domains
MDKDKLNTGENVLERCVFDCERAVISHALVRAKGNLSAAARLLGTTKRILTYKVHKYGIVYEQFKCELNIKEN